MQKISGECKQNGLMTIFTGGWKIVLVLIKQIFNLPKNQLTGLSVVLVKPNSIHRNLCESG